MVRRKKTRGSSRASTTKKAKVRNDKTGRTFKLILILVSLIGVYIIGRPWLSSYSAVGAARLAIADGRYNDAIAGLEQLKRQFGDRSEAHFWLAVAHRRAGNLGKFTTHLNQAKSSGFASAKIYRQQLLVSAQTGQIKSVEEELRAVIAAGAGDEEATDIYAALAQGYLATYRPLESRQCLDLWLERSPDVVPALLLRAQANDRLAEYADAKADLQRALKLEPTRIALRLRLADLQLADNAVNEAKENYAICAESNDADVRSVLGLSECQQRLGEIEDAKRYAESALELAATMEQQSQARYLLGTLAIDVGQYDQAIEQLATAAELAPGYQRIHSSLSTAHARSGDQASAQYHRKLASKINLNDERLHKLLDKLKASSRDIEARFEIGKIMTEREKLDEAIGWFSTVLQFEPMHQRTHVALASIYERKGNIEKSRQHTRLARE